ncbi:MAG: deoxyribose-phosphate aldolase [Anaerolineae bacterium]|nr:deoxyribose-phosphate aldolase [Anaerolineae bacterium]MCX8066589.1 deoxyribose-phosphate aldolase [Anaerolineae bacterium]MDW7991616.1 deoxyribose-phosphate aldolase [Anaerolineae bacterium]
MNDKPRLPLVDFPPEGLEEIIGWLTPQRLAALIDATDLRADTRREKIRTLAEMAVRYRCASVCVNPSEVDLLPRLLAGTGVKECYVVDFPLGRSTIAMKAQQTAEIVRQSRALRGEGPGWVELDMVINVGRFRDDPDHTRREVAAVVEAADGEVVKVIIRSSELRDDEIDLACRLAQEAGAHFVKNSTGMETFGATPEHIRRMREAVGPGMGVKAAGGIREAADAVRLLFAGAREPELRSPDLFRIGTSSPQNLLSTLEVLRADPAAAARMAYHPCSICPSGYAERQSPDLKAYALARCQECPHLPRRAEWVQRG